MCVCVSKSLSLFPKRTPVTGFKICPKLEAPCLNFTPSAKTLFPNSRFHRYQELGFFEGDTIQSIRSTNLNVAVDVIEVPNQLT